MIHECETEPLSLHCDCRLERCTICHVAHSLTKCDLHQPKEHDGQEYYLHELSGQIHNIPRHRVIAAEFEAALMEMGVEIPGGSPATHTALDIGAGIGTYAPWLLRKGYHYEACEIDTWAGKYIEGAYGGPVHRMRFEDLPERDQYDVIIASHCLEHFEDAKAMLAKMTRLLKPSGLLLLLVPDDTDLCNPDHH